MQMELLVSRVSTFSDAGTASGQIRGRKQPMGRVRVRGVKSGFHCCGWCGMRVSFLFLWCCDFMLVSPP